MATISISSYTQYYNDKTQSKTTTGSGTDEVKLYAGTKAFNNVFGSDKCKRTLGGISKRANVDIEKQNSDKVTNNSFNITHNAMILNRDENQQVPYYGRRHFITCNSGNGKGMTYL